MSLSRFAGWPLAAGALLSLGLAGCIPKLGSTFGGGSDAEQTSSADPADAQIAILAEDETVFSPVDIAPPPATKPGSDAPEAAADAAVEATGEAPAEASEQSAESVPETTPETTTAEASPETQAAAAALPLPGAAPQPQGLPGDRTPVPHVYLSLQSQGAGRPVSAIFAIDAARDATPSDDPAIRLTPEDGLCNPQSMTSYNFPEADADRPAVTQADRERGLTAATLPSVMAVVVTERMLEAGLVGTKEDTRAMNICTRKLWQQLVSAGNLPPAGQ